jgi:hypothetical protein
LLDRRSHLLALEPLYVPSKGILRCISWLVRTISVRIELDQSRSGPPLPQLQIVSRKIA